MSRLRSYLFVPADRPDRYSKAVLAGADAVIVDLEDAVSVSAKGDARRQLINGWAKLSAQAQDNATRVLIRINSADSPWFEEDLALFDVLHPDGVILPKAANSLIVGAVAARIPSIALLPLIETAQGVQNVDLVAQIMGVERLVLGTVDLTQEMEADEDEPLDYVRSRIVLASRAAGIESPIDGVCRSVSDATRLRYETTRAVRFGFTAKLCIHPRQVGTVNEAFAPSVQRLEWARQVVAAHEAADGGAVAVNDEMVDLPVVSRARKLLASSQQTD